MNNNTICFLAVIILIIFQTSTFASDKLLYSGDLIYQGAFRVPSGMFGKSTFDYGGTAIAFNPHNKSLFIVGHDWHQQVAEISIPQIFDSTEIQILRTATVIQPFVDITEGNMHNLKAGGATYPNTVKIGGLVVDSNKLIGTVYSYYDGSNEADRSHFVSGLTLSKTGDYNGLYQVGNPPIIPTASYVSGYMALIPQKWQNILGGTVLTGNTTIPITGRTSCGPSAFVFYLDDLGQVNPVPATPIVYYTLAHPTLGKWGTTNAFYNGSTEIKGTVFPEGSRSLLFWGRHGTGEFCYGPGTSDPKLAGMLAPPRGVDRFCYDPASSAKGPHAYPYSYKIWAYDAIDLVAVKNGKTQPWEIKPYAVWNFDLPFQPANRRILGVAYDAATQRIFVSQQAGDGDLPVIHVFKVFTGDNKIKQK